MHVKRAVPCAMFHVYGAILCVSVLSFCFVCMCMCVRTGCENINTLHVCQSHIIQTE
jgi:hypothetical protein